MAENLEKRLKVRQGVVVSNKMDKTIVVKVERRKKHPLYHKTISLSKKFKAHDERNECNEGDIVRIIECRPLSKDKKFRLLEIVQRGEVVESVQPSDEKEALNATSGETEE